jgi:hypothetical protein
MIKNYSARHMQCAAEYITFEEGICGVVLDYIIRVSSSTAPR